MVPPYIYIYSLYHGLWRTICIGMRISRLHTKLIVMLLLMDFDFDTVDAGGQHREKPPQLVNTNPGLARSSE